MIYKVRLTRHDVWYNGLLMLMLKPIAFLVPSLSAGVLLAVTAIASGVPTGWVGALVLIGWAAAARRQWLKVRERHLLEPGAPERILWLRLVSTGMILGHASAALVLVGEDLRLGSGNTLAIDSWTMLAALPVVAVMFRRDRNESDERHEAISAQGSRIRYAVLVAALILLIAYLVFIPMSTGAPLTPFVIANLLVMLILASYVAALITQLAAYGRDTQTLLSDDEFV